MGFGFNLFVVFILPVIILALLIAWIVSKKRIFGKLLLSALAFPFVLFALVQVIGIFINKKNISHDDIYGTYIIDRSKFNSKQAMWQYNHFRFEITQKNRLLFYKTEKQKVVKTYTGTVTFIDGSAQPHIVLKADSPGYHLIDSMPTLYRKPFSFYYVFHSPRFGNVFFKKGNWEETDK
jgi:hypothetical protein